MMKGLMHTAPEEFRDHSMGARASNGGPDIGATTRTDKRRDAPPSRRLSLMYHFLLAIWMVGGNQTIYSNMQTALEGTEEAMLSWLAIELDPEDWITRVPPISFSGAWRNSAATWWRMQPLVQEGGDIDAAYIFGPTLLTFLRRFRRRVPFLLATDMTPLFCARRGLWYAVPQFDPSSRIARVKQRILRSVYASAYHLLPLSTAVRDSFVEDYGIPEQRTTVLPPGVDLDRWNPPDRTAAFGHSPDKPFRVLHVGWDFARKGGDLLVRLAAEPEFQDCEFHFVTSSFVGERGRNIFVHPNVEPNSSRLVALYRDADALVLPTRADTYSIVALEAMAMGLPVVISNVGGISDIVVEGDTGYLLAVDDLATLRDRIRRLRADRPLRLTMGARGRARVEQYFNLEQHAATVLDLLFAAARSRTRGTRYNGPTAHASTRQLAIHTTAPSLGS